MAWNAGISEDIRSLITLSSRRRAAGNDADQVDAQIVWQEWQVIGQARLLAVDLIEGERSLALLRRNRDLLASRYDRSQRAVAAGNETLTTVTPDLAALQTTTDSDQRPATAANVTPASVECVAGSRTGRCSTAEHRPGPAGVGPGGRARRRYPRWPSDDPTWSHFSSVIVRRTPSCGPPSCRNFPI